MKLFIIFIYMILGLCSANQLRIGLVKNARMNGVFPFLIGKVLTK